METFKSIINKIKTFFEKISNNINAKYESSDVFGCPECPPQNCPTFIERDVHKRFKDALINNNIIVVYGESRQGKTWTIERYCKDQLRVGCTATKDIKQLKRDMLDMLDIQVRYIKHSLTTEVKTGSSATTKIGIEMALAAGASVDKNLETARAETINTEYLTVDLDNDIEFLRVVKEKSNGKYFVFDNFHYLSPTVQKQFCSLLKEFNYHGIKVIIVGVWKDASRITAIAPDLVNRCEHIDIGSWKQEELDLVIQKGEKALNIVIDPLAKMQFKKCCARNIGIFKNLLLKFVQQYDIYRTQPEKMNLNNAGYLDIVMKDAINEVYVPLSDRLKNLALPQRNRKESKRLRMKIVVSILQSIRNLDSEKIQNGIGFEEIASGINKLCAQAGEKPISVSNITQELGVIHEREENRQTGGNFIPLFYYDRTNRKLLVIEPTLYEIKAYDPQLIDNLISAIEEAEQEYYNKKQTL